MDKTDFVASSAKGADKALGSVASARPPERSSSEQAVTKGPDLKTNKIQAPSIEAHQNVVKETAVRQNATKMAEDALSVNETKRLVEQLRQALPSSATSLRFVVDEVLDKPIVSVIDQKSGELIRQLPSEEVVRAARNIEIMRGILFDRKS